MLRLVRTQTGEAVPDEEARLPGRGAYICREAECAERAVRHGGLARAFRAPVSITTESIDFIREWQRRESTK